MFSFTRVSPATKHAPCSLQGSSESWNGRRSPTRVLVTRRNGAIMKRMHKLSIQNWFIKIPTLNPINRRLI